MIKFFIPGVPVAKGRPRFARQGKFVVAYTPKKTKDWEEHVKWASIEHRPDKPLEGALRINLDFCMPRPKSIPKHKIHHTKRPDLDNLQKSVIDALQNAALFKDDSQFVRKTATKYYSSVPGVYVEIYVEYTQDYYPQ